MKKKLILSISLAMLCIMAVIFTSLFTKDDKTITLLDRRFTTTDNVVVTSKEDIQIVNDIIDQFKPSEESFDELRYGGVIFIEVEDKERIVTYRVQGSLITKYVEDAISKECIETSYYTSGDNQYKVLSELLDKLIKKMK